MTGWIKICGIRDVVTADAVATAGVEAVGLNFFGKSPRSVLPNVAREIDRALGTHRDAQAKPLTVGLFVNHSLDAIDQIVSSVGLGAIQLHGDETPEFLSEWHRRLPQPLLFKAFRVADSLAPVRDFIAECHQLAVPLAGCLLDAKVEGAYGGTGRVAPWDLIARDYDKLHWPPLILAGGLTPDNVAEAIQTVQPFGIDTASGVESSPGVKDTKLLVRFVAEARRAFAELGVRSVR